MPVESMPGWLRGFAKHQPVSVTINAVRALNQGTKAGGYATGAVLWAVAIIAVCAPDRAPPLQPPRLSHLVL